MNGDVLRSLATTRKVQLSSQRPWLYCINSQHPSPTRSPIPNGGSRPQNTEETRRNHGATAPTLLSRRQNPRSNNKLPYLVTTTCICNKIAQSLGPYTSWLCKILHTIASVKIRAHTHTNSCDIDRRPSERLVRMVSCPASSGLQAWAIAKLIRNDEAPSAG